MHLPQLLCAGALLGACAPASVELVPYDGAVRVEGRRILDGTGRQVVLHGVNARVDGLFDVTFDDGRTALEPIPPFAAEDCRWLADELGLNFLRLPINWSAIEPEPEAYDDSYLDAVVDLVAGCSEHGVVTLVDLHQDAYSKEIGEDGAPLWAIVPPPTELLEGPLDDLDERRTSDQVLAAFRSLYEDAPLDDGRTLQEAYAAMAAHVAGRIDGVPGVAGLELMNEPVSFDHEALDAFHTRVGGAVADVAPDLPLFFEPDAFRNFLDTDPVLYPTSLDHAVYAAHHYTGVFGADPEDPIDLLALRDSALGIGAEAELHGAPGIVGEFGHDPRTDSGRTWIREALSVYDEAGLGWAFWVYEEWSQGGWGLWDEGAGPSRGDLREAAADLLARPFPVAVEGEISSFEWDVERRSARLELVGSSYGVHVFAAPARAWPGDLTALCDGTPTEVLRSQARAAVACDGSVVELFEDP